MDSVPWQEVMTIVEVLSRLKVKEDENVVSIENVVSREKENCMTG
jgi:hypothetical protein